MNAAHPFKPHHINATPRKLKAMVLSAATLSFPGSDGRAANIASFFKNQSVKKHPRQHNLYFGTIESDNGPIKMILLQWQQAWVLQVLISFSMSCYTWAPSAFYALVLQAPCSQAYSHGLYCRAGRLCARRVYVLLLSPPRSPCSCLKKVVTCNHECGQ